MHLNVHELCGAWRMSACDMVHPPSRRGKDFLIFSANEMENFEIKQPISPYLGGALTILKCNKPLTHAQLLTFAWERD
jgi:hypothetical protein